MLAVQSAMDIMRSAGSKSSESRSLLREPSAEDLDAAHQLVSSARGERKNPPSNPESHMRDSREARIIELADTNTGLDTRPPPFEAQEREVPGSFSQVCR